MTDLFARLAALALGGAETVTPALVPRFAEGPPVPPELPPAPDEPAATLSKSEQPALDRRTTDDGREVATARREGSKPTGEIARPSGDTSERVVDVRHSAESEPSPAMAEGNDRAAAPSSDLAYDADVEPARTEKSRPDQPDDAEAGAKASLGATLRRGLMRTDGPADDRASLGPSDDDAPVARRVAEQPRSAKSVPRRNDVSGPASSDAPVPLRVDDAEQASSGTSSPRRVDDAKEPSSDTSIARRVAEQPSSDPSSPRRVDDAEQPSSDTSARHHVDDAEQSSSDTPIARRVDDVEPSRADTSARHPVGDGEHLRSRTLPAQLPSDAIEANTADRSRIVELDERDTTSTVEPVSSKELHERRPDIPTTDTVRDATTKPVAPSSSRVDDTKSDATDRHASEPEHSSSMMPHDPDVPTTPYRERFPHGSVGESAMDGKPSRTDGPRIARNDAPPTPEHSSEAPRGTPRQFDSADPSRLESEWIRGSDAPTTESPVRTFPVPLSSGAGSPVTGDGFDVRKSARPRDRAIDGEARSPTGKKSASEHARSFPKHSTSELPVGGLPSVGDRSNGRHTGSDTAFGPRADGMAEHEAADGFAGDVDSTRTPVSSERDRMRNARGESSDEVPGETRTTQTDTSEGRSSRTRRVESADADRTPRASTTQSAEPHPDLAESSPRVDASLRVDTTMRLELASETSMSDVPKLQTAGQVEVPLRDRGTNASVPEVHDARPRAVSRDEERRRSDEHKDSVESAPNASADFTDRGRYASRVRTNMKTTATGTPSDSEGPSVQARGPAPKFQPRHANHTDDRTTEPSAPTYRREVARFDREPSARAATNARPRSSHDAGRESTRADRAVDPSVPSAPPPPPRAMASTHDWPVLHEDFANARRRASSSETPPREPSKVDGWKSADRSSNAEQRSGRTANLRHEERSSPDVSRVRESEAPSSHRFVANGPSIAPMRSRDIPVSHASTAMPAPQSIARPSDASASRGRTATDHTGEQRRVNPHALSRESVATATPGAAMTPATRPSVDLTTTKTAAKRAAAASSAILAATGRRTETPVSTSSVAERSAVADASGHPSLRLPAPAQTGQLTRRSADREDASPLRRVLPERTGRSARANRPDSPGVRTPPMPDRDPVQIRIGRIRITSEPASKRTMPSASSLPVPSLSLDDYVARRSGESS